MIPRLRMGLLALAASVFVSAACAYAQDISLSVDATQTPQKILHIHEVLPAHPGPMTIYYPKWIPGEHGPDGPVTGLTGLHFSANGQAVPWNRDLLDVYTFHVDVPAGATQLDASYDYLEAPGYSATDKLLVLEWNEVALYPAGSPSRDLTYDARITLPDGWKYGTSLPVASDSGNQVAFRPISFNLLVDSPIITGQYYRAIDITPPGEPIHHELDLAADSEAALAITPALQKDMVNLVAEAGALFGTRHYRDYHFLLALSDHVAHFGLEHHESNDSRLPERALISPNAGMTVGGLLPHEYVHSWNGKFRRPADLTTPDFEKPMETDLLWVYEGLTDYLGPMLAARSGFWTPEEYHEYLASIAAMLGPGRPGRTWRDLQDTATGEPGGGLGGGFARGWMNWRRGTDYYDEGDLLWLEVATIIHQTTHGQKSIDDFCHLFHGGPNDGPQTKTYTFDQLVSDLNAVAPYDWASFLRQRLDSLSPNAPTGGIENGGWKVVLNSQPSHLGGRRGNFGDVYSIGLQVNEEGNISDSIVGSPANKAGIASGMKLVGVDGRVYTPEILQDAIKAAQTSSQPIQLMVVIDDYYQTFKVDYTGGERFPHLVRDDSKPDYLDQLIKPRVAAD
ncbi:MAG: M61 family peptidase [Acidobacteriaceae bacterium]